MRNRLSKFTVALVAAASLAIGGSMLASAANPPVKAKPAKAHTKALASKKAHATTLVRSADATDPSGEAPEQGVAPENDADSAAQAAACKAAGIDPNADNVNYDDATGKCTTDQGGNSGP